MCGAGGAGRRFGLGRLGGQRGQAVPLLKTPRGRPDTASARAHREPVPTPEIALSADEALTRQKLRLKPRAVGGWTSPICEIRRDSAAGASTDRREARPRRQGRGIVVAGQRGPAAFARLPAFGAFRSSASAAPSAAS
jgi:hypothetical protein